VYRASRGGSTRSRVARVAPSRASSRAARPRRPRRACDRRQPSSHRCLGRDIRSPREERACADAYAHARGARAVFGVVRIAFKLLANDRGKFLALVTGIAFSVFLMVQMTSMFAGFMRKASSTVMNTGARVWVMDRAVNNVLSSIPMPDYVLDAVRSIPGVRFAVPLYSGSGLVRLRSGAFQPVTVLGLDDASLYGRPELAEGRIADIYAENGFIVVDDEELMKLGNPTIGTDFEINDHRGVIVGIARVPASGLFGMPTLYTTYSRAIQYLPPVRFTTSYVLVEPVDDAAIPRIEADVARLGYTAMTQEAFVSRITNYYTWHTGLGTNIMLMTAISFIVGLSISGQTFYSFTLENLPKFGALKAIGAKRRVLITMLLVQAAVSSLAGYGLGVGLCALVIALARQAIPDYASVITFPILGLALGMVVIIAGVSSYVAVRKVLRIEPFEIFRS
jgi:putative ABC transport system permease protein